MRALTSVPVSSMTSACSRLPLLTRSAMFSARAVVPPASSRAAMAALSACRPFRATFIRVFPCIPVLSCCSDFRQHASAVAETLFRNTGALHDGQQQVGMRGVLRIGQVLAALDAATGLAEQGAGQRIVVVTVAVAHVGAEQDQRVVQYGAVAFLHG